MPETPRIYCDRASKNARNIIEEMDVELVDVPGKADLLWMRRTYDLLQHHLDEHQLLNHIPDEYALIDKGDLTTILAAYDGDESSLRREQFYPDTYRLYDPADRQAFFDQLPEEPDKDQPWILKPTDMSMGRGVSVAWQFDHLRQLYGNPDIDDLIRTKKVPRYLAQRYITNPLLLNERKSEIRIYWLIAGLDPLTVLMFPEGTARLTTLPFVMDDFNNQLVHVTNSYQQKNHPDYDPDAVLKWDFAQLDRYIAEDLGLADHGYLDDRLLPRVRECLAHVVYAALGRLRSASTKGHYFGLYGADFIIDDNLDPWLTEVQRGPGLSFTDDIKKRVVPVMLQQALEIVLQVRQTKINGKTPTPEDVGDFQWVINEAG